MKYRMPVNPQLTFNGLIEFATDVRKIKWNGIRNRFEMSCRLEIREAITVTQIDMVDKDSNKIVTSEKIDTPIDVIFGEIITLCWLFKIQDEIDTYGRTVEVIDMR